MTRDVTIGWRASAAIRAGTPLLRALASTWRYRVRNRSALDAVRANEKPFIFSLWHGHLLPLIWFHRGQGIRILVSEHRDGEIIATVAESLGYGTIRGSTTRGGERALLSLIRVLEEGMEVAVTPDGPRGPAWRYQPGALVAAARARVPILPIAAYADRAWRLRSWDRFIVPKPFATITVAYANPVMVDANSPRAAATQADVLEAAMNSAVAAANA
jgi:lysophospholipid acyltransferase (LPLAT)-like uncharacterized protein